MTTPPTDPRNRALPAARRRGQRAAVQDGASEEADL